MQNGHCARGAQCNFAHSDSEIRDPDSDTNSEEEMRKAEIDVKASTEQEEQASSIRFALPPGLDAANTRKPDMSEAIKEYQSLCALAHALDKMLSSEPTSSTSFEDDHWKIADSKTSGGFMEVPAYMALPTLTEAPDVRSLTNQRMQLSDQHRHLTDLLTRAERDTSSKFAAGLAALGPLSGFGLPAGTGFPTIVQSMHTPLSKLCTLEARSSNGNPSGTFYNSRPICMHMSF